MRKIRRGVRPIAVLPLGFLLIILFGACLLMLPAASASGARLSFSDALFTSTSASCVTGLIVADTGTDFTLFGQIVIIVLIQLGGLGFMTMSTLLFALTRRRISLYDRMTMAEGIGEDKLTGVVRLCRKAVLVTFCCEGIGALLFLPRFIPAFGLARGIWVSVFTAISAFCNAGFDLMGNYTSLTAYTGDALVLLVVSALIITGGLGFAVIDDVRHTRGIKRYKLHAKLVLAGTVGLLVLGTVAVLALEYDNGATLGNMPFFEKVLNAFFQSVTFRTAGFNSIDQLAMRESTKGVGVLLMLAGGAPAGTAGGLKVTTVLTLLLTVYAYVRGRYRTVVLGRSIPLAQIRKALTIFVCGVSFVLVVTILISAMEQDLPGGAFGIWNQLFEATSAFCTVGLSVGLTAAATTGTRMLLALLMYVGRVGLLSVAMSLANVDRQEGVIAYPEESIMIG